MAASDKNGFKYHLNCHTLVLFIFSLTDQSLCELKDQGKNFPALPFTNNLLTIIN